MIRLLAIPLVTLAFTSGALVADDLRETRHLLCSTLKSDVCLKNEGCATLAPEALNIPQFITFDARTGVLSTTAASGRSRVTKADSVSRGDGQLILQGVQDGRAFSFYIDEASGDATFAVAANWLSVSVFAACTPATGK
jgi:hypothetical protein